MTPKPARCEPFEGEYVLPGWICCVCRHYNADNRKFCYECEHGACKTIALRPPGVARTAKLHKPVGVTLLGTPESARAYKARGRADKARASPARSLC